MYMHVSKSWVLLQDSPGTPACRRSAGPGPGTPAEHVYIYIYICMYHVVLL